MTRFTRSAAAFVRRERRYLADRSRAAAIRFASDVAEVARLLDEYPAAGGELLPLKGSSLDGIRRWARGNYTYDYEIDAAGEAFIILVRHHAQNDPFTPFEAEDPDADFDP